MANCSQYPSRESQKSLGSTAFIPFLLRNPESAFSPRSLAVSPENNRSSAFLLEPDWLNSSLPLPYLPRFKRMEFFLFLRATSLSLLALAPTLREFGSCLGFKQGREWRENKELPVTPWTDGTYWRLQQAHSLLLSWPLPQPSSCLTPVHPEPPSTLAVHLPPLIAQALRCSCCVSVIPIPMLNSFEHRVQGKLCQRDDKILNLRLATGNSSSSHRFSPVLWKLIQQKNIIF